MPGRKKRPHPRSLDALFPRPKVRRCARGHSQTPTWRPTHGCSTCEADDFRRIVAEEQALHGAAEREHWRRILGPPPDDMSFRTTLEGKLIRNVIPRHLQRRGPRRRGVA